MRDCVLRRPALFCLVALTGLLPSVELRAGEPGLEDQALITRAQSPGCGTSGWVADGGCECCDSGGYVSRLFQDHCGRFRIRNLVRSRTIAGQSCYPRCPPLCAPNYGFHNPCWRRMPDMNRCPPVMLERHHHAAEPLPSGESVPLPPAFERPTEVPPQETN